MQRANPDLDAIERWRAKDAEFVKRSAEVEASRDERDVVSKNTVVDPLGPGLYFRYMHQLLS